MNPWKTCQISAQVDENTESNILFEHKISEQSFIVYSIEPDFHIECPAKREEKYIPQSTWV